MSKSRDHILKSSTYDRLKYTTEIVLPGVGALYFALAQIWSLPNAEEVVGSIAAFTVFLGLLLGYSRKSYNDSDSKFDGAMVVQDTEEGKMFSLELDSDPEEMQDMKEVKFKVQK